MSQYKQLSQVKLITFLRYLKNLSDEVLASHHRYAKLLNVVKLGKFLIHTDKRIRENGIAYDFYILRISGDTLEHYNRELLDEVVQAGFYMYDQPDVENMKFITTLDPERSIDIAKLMLYDVVVELFCRNFNSSTRAILQRDDNIIDYIFADLWDIDNQLMSIVEQAMEEASRAQKIEDPTDTELSIYYSVKSQLLTEGDYDVIGKLLQTVSMNEITVCTDVIICEKDLSEAIPIIKVEKNAYYVSDRIMNVIKRACMTRTFDVFTE